MNVRTMKANSVTKRTALAVDKLQKAADRWLTADERQLIERAMEQSGKNTDAGFLALLYSDYGFSPQMLIEFIGKFRAKYAYMENDLNAAVEDIAAVGELKELGVDLEAIYGGDA